MIFNQKNIAKLITRYSKKKYYQIFAKGLFKKLVSVEKKIAIALLITQATIIHVINNLTSLVNISTLALAIKIIITSQDIVLSNKVTIYKNVSKLV